MLARATLSVFCSATACSSTLSSEDRRPEPPGPREGTPTDSGGASVGAILGGVTWRFAWNRDGLLPSDTGSWQIERADGAGFQMVSGWLILESVALEPCEDPEAGARSPPPHGWPDHPSADTDTWALPLHEDVDRELSQHRFEPERVCEVGVGLFQAQQATRNLPSEPDLLGTSLWLAGQVRAAPTDPWTPVEWHSSLSAEHDALLPELPELPEAEAVLTVTLAPASLLDAVSLDDPPELAGRSVLTNLARSLSVAAHP